MAQHCQKLLRQSERSPRGHEYLRVWSIIIPAIASLSEWTICQHHLSDTFRFINGDFIKRMYKKNRWGFWGLKVGGGGGLVFKTCQIPVILIMKMRLIMVHNADDSFAGGGGGGIYHKRKPGLVLPSLNNTIFLYCFSFRTHKNASKHLIYN